MNMIDAARMAEAEGLWFRPLSWQGAGIALEVKGDYLYVRTNPISGSEQYRGRFSHLFREWEVVNPDVVNGEVNDG